MYTISSNCYLSVGVHLRKTVLVLTKGKKIDREIDFFTLILGSLKRAYRKDLQY